MQRSGATRGLTTSLLAALLLPVLAGAAGDAPTAHASGARAHLGLIIDDLGNSLADGQRVLRLPGPVAGAILPHTTYSRALAQALRSAGKEVLLHLPMQPQAQEPEALTPGPGMLERGMSAHELAHMLEYNLATVPQAVGINNHMGSLLTQEPEPMHHLMRALRQRGLFFVDSLTTPASVAARVAREHRVPALVREVFLDNARDAAAIDRQLAALVTAARRNGHALGIGHPYPETLAALERWLPGLARHDIELVPLSTLLTRNHQGAAPWHASLSR